MSSISMFVTMFLSPFTGTIVDKINRKWVLIIGDAFQGSLMLTIGILAYTDALNIPIVLFAAFLASLGGVLYSPASSTVLIDIIPRDDIVRGQSLFSGVSNTINMIGTALSGVMVAFFGVPLIIIINGCSNLYAALSELFISVPKTVKQGENVSIKGIITDSKIALKTIFKDPCLSIFIPCAVIINFLGAGPFTLMIPFTAQKGFSEMEYGLLMSTWMAAAIICVVILGIIKFTQKARYWIMAICFSASCIFSIMAYLSTQFIPMCIFVFLGGFCNTAGNTIFGASMMLALPEENRGAILGFFSASTTCGIAISTVTYGFLGDIFPLYIIFTIGSLLSIAPMMYMCFNPKVKSFILENT